MDDVLSVNSYASSSVTLLNPPSPRRSWRSPLLLASFTPLLHSAHAFAVNGAQLTAIVCQRLHSWWNKKSTKDVLLESLEEARLFEEWEAAAFHLDEVLGFDLWYVRRESGEPR
jgi:hypothetical protein